ncbi:MAG: M48 family metalloprotease [Rhodobacteraceae bacterium]|nr:M48 family metalloprotease [Paracoccaceae bacterium]
MRRFFALLVFLAACDVTVDAPSSAPVQAAQPAASGPKMSYSQAASAFARVQRRVEPTAEKSCRDINQGQVNCDFKIQISKDRDAPPNAYQSLDKSGRPLITFTPAMLTTFRNADEIAFVMGHEAAHHIRGHLARQSRDAAIGAILGTALVAAAGGSANDISAAQDLGAFVGGRSYSKSYELEADSLGTVITDAAGYSPRRGVEYFYGLPDPGNRFLGTHPPNNSRISVVQNTIKQYNLD